MSLRHRLKRGWSAFCGSAPNASASAAEIDRLINRLRFAAQIKELPMPIIDDINALDTTIAAALAAKDAEAAANVGALAAANQTITALTDEISTAGAAVVALTTKYAPPVEAVAEPVADPAVNQIPA